MNKPKDPHMKICPFCGGKAVLMQMAEEGKPMQYFVGCLDITDCLVSSSTRGHDDPNVAADAWNRRGRIILQ